LEHENLDSSATPAKRGKLPSPATSRTRGGNSTVVKVKSRAELIRVFGVKTGELLCQGGVCKCPGADVVCAGACVDTSADSIHCGTCGTNCFSNNLSSCQGGVCK
jgi:hypothetical protein